MQTCSLFVPIDAARKTNPKAAPDVQLAKALILKHGMGCQTCKITMDTIF
ncbi:MAG: hypothetical protein GY874_13025 [Desulfobacteraceae bacterium]|nr:hypothetical protein [Desulfobacteraceae bacterium]